MDEKATNLTENEMDKVTGGIGRIGSFWRVPISERIVGDVVVPIWYTKEDIERLRRKQNNQMKK